ncbi:2-dehydropantoate 2-reductase [Streptomyces sp. ODS28]|uniref:2-dehydropantoate 2-reductase n=1 Tax=Streptomyces sp. ODS28 TaxID=3136688 RepID=UPI0031E91E56
MHPAPTPSAASPARVAVIGGGAIGGLLAAFAYECGPAATDVTLCVRTPVDGLTVHTGGETVHAPVRVVTSPDELSENGRPPHADWVFLTTKAQDTPGAEGWLRALCGPGTTVAVVQNGVDHEERVAPLVPPGTALLPTLAFMAVERTGPGRIVHHTANHLHVPEGEAADRLAALLAGSRLEVRPVPDFTTAAWRKMFTNLAANPLTSLLQQRMGLFAEPEVRALAQDILREAVAVARAEGAEVGEDDVRRALKQNASVPPDGGTSMLYDRLAGRPLEHEHITGAVVRAAARHGIDVPLNRMLLTLLRAVDRELRGAGA